MMKQCFLTIVALVVCVAAGAQNADKLYKDGKALYDAKNYTAATRPSRRSLQSFRNRK